MASEPKMLALESRDAHCSCGVPIIGHTLIVHGERHELKELCDRCIYTIERAEIERERFAARQVDNAQRAERAQRIPKRFRDADVERLSSELRATCLAWMDQVSGEDARSLMLTGTVGSGKTFAAWATLRAAILDGARIEAWRVSSLLDALRPGGENDALMSACQTAQILFLDDLGAEKPSEWVAERLYTIIDARYADCLPVLVTTNVPRAHMASMIGERLTSRLAEMCDVFVLNDDDRRLKRART